MNSLFTAKYYIHNYPKPVRRKCYTYSEFVYGMEIWLRRRKYYMEDP